MVFGMFSTDTNKSSDLQRLVIEPATRVYNDLSGKWDALGKQVANWTEKNLPKQHLARVMRIFNALPIALVTALMPAAILVPAAITSYIVHIAYGPYKQSTYDMLFAGATLGMALKGTINLASFLVTFHPLYAVTGILYGVAAGALFSRSNLS